MWKSCNENTEGSLKKKNDRSFFQRTFDFTVIKLASLKKLKEKPFVKRDLTNSKYEIHVFHMIKTNQSLSSSLCLHRDLYYIRTFTVPANNVPKFSQPDKKYSYLENLLLFSSKNLQLVAARGPMRGPINRERAWHAKNGDRGPFSLDRQFHFSSIKHVGVTA